MDVRKLVTAMIAVSSLSFAGQYDCCNPCPQPCDPCDSCFGGFDVGADFLYWKPCVDDLDYAAVSTSGTVGDATGTLVDYRGICPEWEPGFRVWVGKSDVLCGWDIAASFTWMKSDDKAAFETSDLSIYSTLGHAALLGDTTVGAVDIAGNLFNVAAAEWDSKFYAWDVLFAHPLDCCGPCFEFVPFFGVSGIYLTQEFNSAFANTLDTADTATALFATNWESKYWGVGLKFGSDFNYHFNDCLSLFALGSAEILAGEATTGYNRQVLTLGDDTVVAAQFNDNDCCLLVPGYHIAAGFRYASDWCGTDFGIRIGYEFLKYYNVPNARTFMGDQFATQAALSTSANTRTFGFHGLLVGADVSF